MEIFELSKKFPKEEQYALTTQIRNSSRSIPANIAEGWAKRKYINVFKRHIIDAIGSCDETKVWIDFALDCKYISEEKHRIVTDDCNEIGRMLNGLYENWKSF
ncbi:MAG: four helix bundle protein [Deltaproteobacteria bacterium]|nr:four helix bundle protein [Deltaproteobacteria bacterium]